MRPLFEKVTVPPGASWSLLDRRLPAGIPFEWHYHPEFELTLTLNSRGQRFIGDAVDTYDDGDLVLIGPNLPHTWSSVERIDQRQPHIALVMWFTEDWSRRITTDLAELQPVGQMLASAERGIAFSPTTAARARPIVERIPALRPAERLIHLMEVLAVLAADEGRQRIASPAAGRHAIASPDRARIERVLDHIHEHYRERITIAELAGVAALSTSGFHRLFHRHTRLTVGDYVAQLRIGQACALLSNSYQPIAHVAEAVGYISLANFNRRFLAMKGMTPRAFRRSFAASSQSPADYTRMGIRT